VGLGDFYSKFFYLILRRKRGEIKIFLGAGRGNICIKSRIGGRVLVDGDRAESISVKPSPQAAGGHM